VGEERAKEKNVDDAGNEGEKSAGKSKGDIGDGELCSRNQYQLKRKQKKKNNGIGNDRGEGGGPPRAEGSLEWKKSGRKKPRPWRPTLRKTTSIKKKGRGEKNPRKGRKEVNFR